MFGFACGSELSRPPRAVSRRPLGVGVVVELAAADDNEAARAVQGGLGLGLSERRIIAVRKRMFAFIIPLWVGRSAGNVGLRRSGGIRCRCLSL